MPSVCFSRTLFLSLPVSGYHCLCLLVSVSLYLSCVSVSPLQHPTTPFPEFRLFPSPNSTAMHLSPSPLPSDQLAGSDPLSISMPFWCLTDHQDTTLSSYPHAGTLPPPPASGHEGLWQSQLNSFGPLASLTPIDTDQTKPTPSPDVE